MEIIVTSKMQVLSDFDFADEPRGNIAHYYLGIIDKYFVVSIKDLVGNYISKVFFDRHNFDELIKLLEDVYAGKLYESSETALQYKANNDYILVSVFSAMPHTATRPIEQLYIQNVRPAILDGREDNGFSVYTSLETGKKMLAEMKRIAPEVTR